MAESQHRSCLQHRRVCATRRASKGAAVILVNELASLAGASGWYYDPFGSLRQQPFPQALLRSTSPSRQHSSSTQQAAPMKEFLILNYNDVTDSRLANDPERWSNYVAMLHSRNALVDGSALGDGIQCQIGQPDRSAISGLDGVLRIRAASLAAARDCLHGNPTWDAGGTVEIREWVTD